MVLQKLLPTNQRPNHGLIKLVNVSELGPRVAQRAQVAEVATYYNAVWQC